MGEPIKGWCIEHAAKVTKGDRCPSGHPDCSPACLDWRKVQPNGHQVASIDPAIAEELSAAVDEELQEEPADLEEQIRERETVYIPPATYTGHNKAPADVRIQLVYNDPALDALKRVANGQGDLVLVAYELGLARGAKDALERACLTD
jgi:hypothetical protein